MKKCMCRFHPNVFEADPLLRVRFSYDSNPPKKKRGKITVYTFKAPRGSNRLVPYDKFSEMLNAHDQSANALSSITKTTKGEICPNTMEI